MTKIKDILEENMIYTEKNFHFFDDDSSNVSSSLLLEGDHVEDIYTLSFVEGEDKKVDKLYLSLENLKNLAEELGTYLEVIETNADEKEADKN